MAYLLSCKGIKRKKNILKDPKNMSKNFFPKKDLKNDFENHAEVPPMFDNWDHLREGHKTIFFNFLKHFYSI